MYHIIDFTMSKYSRCIHSENTEKQLSCSSNTQLMLLERGTSAHNRGSVSSENMANVFFFL